MTPEEIRELVAEAQKEAGGPAAHAPGSPSAPTTIPESAARGAFQGLSSGFGDEASAALAAALPFTDPEAAKGETLKERYSAARDFYRKLNESAREANPKSYLGGQIAGSVVGAGKAAPGMAGVLKTAGQGMAAGAGYSEADDIGGLVGDTSLGGGLGLAGHALGAGASKVGGVVVGKATDLVNRARGKAGTQAAEEVAAQLAALSGQVGAETQKGSRQIENLMRLHDAMTPAQKEAYAELVANGVVPNLQQSVAQGTLEALPGQAGAIAARRAALAEAQAGAGAATASRAEQLLTPQKGRDLASFVKAYGEPLAWGAAGVGAGKALDLDTTTQSALGVVAGAIGGRTRAGKALMTRLGRPAHQLEFAEALKKAAEAGSPLARELLRLSAPAAVMSRVATEED